MECATGTPRRKHELSSMSSILEGKIGRETEYSNWIDFQFAWMGRSQLIGLTLATFVCALYIEAERESESENERGRERDSEEPKERGHTLAPIFRDLLSFADERMSFLSVKFRCISPVEWCLRRISVQNCYQQTIITDATANSYFSVRLTNMKC